VDTFTPTVIAKKATHEILEVGHQDKFDSLVDSLVVGLCNESTPDGTTPPPKLANNSDATNTGYQVQ
jgi:hypothetical protein